MDGVCGFFNIVTCFWIFLLLDALLCPFSLASFLFSWSLAINFGLFSQELRHYVHFRHRLLHSLPLCHLILDIFASWCFLMSIFTSILSLFVVADDEFWTFFPRIAPLCPFSAQALAVSSIRWLEYTISNNSDLQTVKNIFKTFLPCQKPAVVLWLWRAFV